MSPAASRMHRRVACAERVYLGVTTSSPMQRPAGSRVCNRLQQARRRNLDAADPVMPACSCTPPVPANVLFDALLQPRHTAGQ